MRAFSFLALVSITIIKCLRKGKLLSFLDVSPSPFFVSNCSDLFEKSNGNFISDFVGFNPNCLEYSGGKSIKIFPVYCVPR